MDCQDANFEFGDLNDPDPICNHRFVVKRGMVEGHRWSVVTQHVAIGFWIVHKLDAAVW